MNSFDLDIGSGDFHPIDQILMAGEVSDNDCGKAKPDRAAEPAELVRFAKHLNVFQSITSLLLISENLLRPPQRPERSHIRNPEDNQILVLIPNRAKRKSPVLKSKSAA